MRRGYGSRSEVERGSMPKKTGIPVLCFPAFCPRIEILRKISRGAKRSPRAAKGPVLETGYQIRFTFRNRISDPVLNTLTMSF